jgi:AhpD family alkylhydroperoxidase
MSIRDWDEYHKQILAGVGEMGRVSLNTVKGYRTLGDAAAGTGRLGAKINELIALAVAVATRCHGRIAVHMAAAIRAGATREEVAEALGIAAAENAGAALVCATRVKPCLARGGLAPWQVRRTEQILSENLDGEVTLAHLASECRLSVGHFARAFKQTTGQPPHRWLLAQRVEHAKRLLLTSALPLANIAPACGFADQSHFTRVFSQMVGAGPGAWRRAWKVRAPRDPERGEASGSREGAE